MKILIVGSGGREHALAWKLKQSPLVSEIVCAPGNPGIAAVARLAPIPVDDVSQLAGLAVREQPDLVVVGPEAPLAAGLADRLRSLGIAVFGPSQAAAQLEASKAFARDFCDAHSIPSAGYRVFDDAPNAKAYLADREPPFVIKADGLAAGKGVIVAETRREADAAIDEILFLRKFGTAGQRIVIEDFLPGEEVSVFALSDGESAIAFEGAQDHKRAFDGDKGPNTGGMGAYSPAPIADPALIALTMSTIMTPTIRAMKSAGAPFQGVLYAGLMISPQGPKQFEFNVRFGDPECQTLMVRLKSDLVPYLMACAKGGLKDLPPLEWDPRPAVTVVMAAQGYPDHPLTGSVIRGVQRAEQTPGVMVFHAGTRQDEDGLLGGRVLNITAIGDTLKEAADRAYQALDRLDWPGGYYRRDIAWRALATGAAPG
jgi:phosphoribosylamine--glycine ligase